MIENDGHCAIVLFLLVFFCSEVYFTEGVLWWPVCMDFAVVHFPFEIFAETNDYSSDGKCFVYSSQCLFSYVI
jgi:hypothetical protein